MLIWRILLTCRNTKEFNERENILILKNNETQEKTTQTYLQISNKSIIPFEKNIWDNSYYHQDQQHLLKL